MASEFHSAYKRGNFYTALKDYPSDEIKKGDKLKCLSTEGDPYHKSGWVRFEIKSGQNGYAGDLLASLFDPSEGQDPVLSDTNPKDLLGIKKVQLNLVPASSQIYQALAMENGAKKYGAYNWRTKKVIASIYLAAAMRHLQSWQDGEELAEDSGVPHLAHALACLGIIVDAKETGNLSDDRPTPGAASALIKRLEKKQ